MKVSNVGAWVWLYHDICALNDAGKSFTGRTVDIDSAAGEFGDGRDKVRLSLKEVACVLLWSVIVIMHGPPFLSTFCFFTCVAFVLLDGCS